MPKSIFSLDPLVDLALCNAIMKAGGGRASRVARAVVAVLSVLAGAEEGPAATEWLPVPYATSDHQIADAANDTWPHLEVSEDEVRRARVSLTANDALRTEQCAGGYRAWLRSSPGIVRAAKIVRLGMVENDLGIEPGRIIPQQSDRPQ